MLVLENAEKEEFKEKRKELEKIALPILQNLSGDGMPGAGGFPGAGAGGFHGGATSSGAPEPADDGPKIDEID